MAKRKYTFEQRLEVVMHYFATDDGYRITSARFNVPRTQVRMWVAAYDAYGEEGLRPRDKGVLMRCFQGKYPGVRRQPNTSLLVQPPSADG